jgi:quercetin dioxygenase-like cupin family protein
MRRKTMTKVMIAVCLGALTLAAQDAKITPMLTKELAEMPGKEASMVTVEYAPGGSSAAHRHNAHVFVYVLEGTVVMQLKGGGEVTLGPGQTFYESPEDVHAVSRNASKTKPAKFVVFFIKQTGAPPTVPIN